MTRADRMTAARGIGRLLATAEGRAYLENAGYESGMPIIVADFDDPVGTTLDRIRVKGNAGLVVTAADSGDLLFAVFERHHADSTESEEVSRFSTIGLLLRASQSHGASFRFTLTDTKVSAKVPLSMPEFA